MKTKPPTHNYEVIRELVTETPALLMDLNELLKRYKARCGPSPLSRASLGRITRKHASQWLGIPELKRKVGRPRLHDEDRVIWLRDQFPDANPRAIADLYNMGSTRPYLSTRKAAEILSERG